MRTNKTCRTPSGKLQYKNRTKCVGNICLSKQLGKAYVLLTKIYSFEIQPTNPFQFATGEYSAIIRSNTATDSKSGRANPPPERDHKYIALWNTQLASSVQHLCKYYSTHIVYTSRLHTQAYMNDRKKA